jgi:hypothetical protein
MKRPTSLPLYPCPILLPVNHPDGSGKLPHPERHEANTRPSSEVPIMKAMFLYIWMFLPAMLLGCSQADGKDAAAENKPITGMHTAVFAGGCFWCTEADFEKVDGVVEAVSGYTGGSVANPTYEQVSAGGGTGHIEAVQVLL